MEKILGIVNLEGPYVNVEGIDEFRPVSAASFLGRYRVVDFTISNMTNSNIQNIHLYIKKKPRSMIDHISGTNYNINTKRGHITIFHGDRNFTNQAYNTDIANMLASKNQIEASTAEYVVIAPSHFIFVQDFRQMLDFHIENGNDITILYQSVNEAKTEFIQCDTLEFEEAKKIKNIAKNIGKYKNRDISLETYVMSKSLFLTLLNKADETSSFYWLRDIVADVVNDYKIVGYQHKGYAKCISSMKKYYLANLESKDGNVLKNIVNEKWPIYTKTNDTCPTLYKNGANVENSLVGNGCIIEGEVVNSVIGRDVVIKKGAVVTNSIVMSSSYIGEDVEIENAVIDRFATVKKIKEVKGSSQAPLYVERRDTI